MIFLLQGSGFRTFCARAVGNSPFKILVGNTKKFSNFMNSFLTNFDTLKNSKLAKQSSLKFTLKKPYLSQYLIDSAK